jgi:hypothetical protein
VPASPASQAAITGTTTVSGVASTGIMAVSRRGMPLVSESAAMPPSGSVRPARSAARRSASSVYPASSGTEIGATVHDGSRRAATPVATEPAAAPATSQVSSPSA